MNFAADEMLSAARQATSHANHIGTGTAKCCELNRGRGINGGPGTFLFNSCARPLQRAIGEYR